MSTPGEHVGVDALLAERKELLDRYDAVKMKGGYDAVESQHGNAAEDYFRAFLTEFLPKKYGVTKGHVITPGLGYAGDLEGWDVIIYDALESPILFDRPSLIDPEATRLRLGVRPSPPWGQTVFQVNLKLVLTSHACIQSPGHSQDGPSNHAPTRSVCTAAAVASLRARFSHSCGINVSLASLGRYARTCERYHLCGVRPSFKFNLKLGLTLRQEARERGIISKCETFH